MINKKTNLFFIRLKSFSSFKSIGLKPYATISIMPKGIFTNNSYLKFIGLKPCATISILPKGILIIISFFNCIGLKSYAIISTMPKGIAKLCKSSNLKSAIGTIKYLTSEFIPMNSNKFHNIKCCKHDIYKPLIANI